MSDFEEHQRMCAMMAGSAIVNIQEQFAKHTILPFTDRQRYIVARVLQHVAYTTALHMAERVRDGHDISYALKPPPPPPSPPSPV